MSGRYYLGDYGQNPSTDTYDYVFQETGIYPDQQEAVATSQALSRYTSDQIMQTFNALLATFHSESQQFADMNQWFNANGNTLTPEGQQEYAAGIQLQGQVVNAIQDGLVTFSSVLQKFGYAASVPGLSGLGVFPVGAALFITAIIAIVLGASWYEYWSSQSDLAHQQTEQAKQKVMQTAQANVPALVAAGWTPDQIAAYLKQQQDANAPSFLDSIPWKTIAFAGVAVVGIRAVFG